MKLIFGIIALFAGFILLIFGINFYLTPKDDLKKADIIVAVSGGDTEARAKTAVDLYKDGIASKILFSGAALDPASPSNAKVMKDVALDAGVHEVDILIDEYSSNTEENAEHSKSILNSQQYKTVVLVTSPYHQRRAYLEFSDKLEQEVEIINYSSSDESWPSTWWLTPWGWWLGLSETVKTAATAARNTF